MDILEHGSNYIDDRDFFKAEGGSVTTLRAKQAYDNAVYVAENNFIATIGYDRATIINFLDSISGKQRVAPLPSALRFKATDNAFLQKAKQALDQYDIDIAVAKDAYNAAVNPTPTPTPTVIDNGGVGGNNNISPLPPDVAPNPQPTVTTFFTTKNIVIAVIVLGGGYYLYKKFNK